MRITHKKKPLQFAYSVDNISLLEVTEYKYLGLWITNELSWTKHIDTVIANSLRKLFFLRRSLKSSTSSVRLLAYNSYIRPLLEYAVIIWDPFTLTNIKKLERVQHKVVRFVFNSYGRASVSELVRRSGLPPVTVRNRICRLKFLFQLVNGHYNINTSKFFTYSSGYNTRRRHALSITPLNARNNVFKYSFFPRTITDWNNLNSEIVTQNSLSMFEKCLQML